MVRPWTLQTPDLPVVVDEQHQLAARLGLGNVPMAVWTEGGRVVRPAHQAAVRENRMKGQAPPPDVPERLGRLLTAVGQLPDPSADYLPSLEAWAAGGDPPPATAPERTPQQAEAHAAFALGRHLWASGDKDGARSWWKRAHALDPDLWAAKRQAWTFETTPEGSTESDLGQEAQDVYGTSWLDDIERLGPERYYPS
jgi:hypothetical protein